LSYLAGCSWISSSLRESERGRESERERERENNNNNNNNNADNTPRLVTKYVVAIDHPVREYACTDLTTD